MSGEFKYLEDFLYGMVQMCYSNNSTHLVIQYVHKYRPIHGWVIDVAIRKAIIGHGNGHVSLMVYTFPEMRAV